MDQIAREDEISLELNDHDDVIHEVTPVVDHEVKHEVVAAYNAVLSKLKVMKRVPNEPTPEEQIIEAEREIVEKVAVNNTESFARHVSETKLFINRTLEEIQNKILPQYELFENLTQAIAFSKKELNELYDIRVNADTFKALIMAQKEREETFEKEMQAKRAAFENEIKQHERERRQEENQYNIELEAARRREQEHFEEHKRKQEQELAAAQAAFEAECKSRETRMEDEFNAREARIASRENEHQKLKQREAKIMAREQEYQQLKTRAMSYPEDLRNAVQRAEQTVTDKLTRKYEYDIKLMQIELDSERKLFQQKVNALEEQIEQYKMLKQHFSQPNFVPSIVGSDESSEQ